MMKKNITKGQLALGAKKSKKDSRDYKYSSYITSDSPVLPKKIDHSVHMPPVRDQGTQGSCVAQTVASMKEYQENLDVGFNSHMSPQFVYDQRPNDGSGMYCRDAFKILKSQGICSEEAYPYRNDASDSEPDPKSIPPEASVEAKKYKIAGYAQIDTFDELQRALVKNGPCLGAFPVYAEYDKEEKEYHFDETNFWLPIEGRTMIGGHAMAIVGYDDEQACFLIRNSWGESWGPEDNGYVTFPYKDWGFHWEVWTALDEKTIQEKPVPSATQKSHWDKYGIAYVVSGILSALTAALSFL